VAGESMSMPRKGWRIRRSLSPVRMREALPLTARERNLSSLGWRQAVITMCGSINSRASRNSAKRYSLFWRFI
jgi:hypothetical protein